MPQPSHTHFMSQALELAKQAKASGDLPFGAVVVCGNKVVGKGKCEDNTVGDVTDHAEMIAVRNACRFLQRNELRDCAIYSTTEPCPMCATAIFHAKIPLVIIGLKRDELSHVLRPRKIKLQDIAHDSGYKVDIVSGVLHEQILHEFADVKR